MCVYLKPAFHNASLASLQVTSSTNNNANFSFATKKTTCQTFSSVILLNQRSCIPTRSVFTHAIIISNRKIVQQQIGKNSLPRHGNLSFHVQNNARTVPLRLDNITSLNIVFHTDKSYTNHHISTLWLDYCALYKYSYTYLLLTCVPKTSRVLYKRHQHLR